MSHPIPIPKCQITADDQPLNALIQARIMRVRVTDNRSLKADELEITLDDHDGALLLPKRGVVLHIWLGWDDGVFDKGKFTVDQVEWSGTPDIISVKARSADFTSDLKVGKRQSYHGQTFGQVANICAQRNNLILNMSSALANIQLGHVDQTDESDINLLTRLARAHGAETSIKQQKLLIFKAGTAKTSSGQSLPTITITRADGDRFHYGENDRDHDYTGVEAFYQEDGKAKRTGATVGDDTKVKRLKGTFATEDDATAAAQAEQDRIKRDMATFTMTKAIGIPEISTESPVALSGWKKSVDALSWIVSKATHDYEPNSGLTTELELEAQVD